MLHRRDFAKALILVAGTGALLTRSASAAEEKEPKMADFLFVQNAQGIVYENGKMTLKGVAPLTVAFSDRPERIAGHLSTKEFIPFWSEGKDSFLKDPPNANVSILDGGKVTDVVVVLSNPLLMGDDLTYDVKILEGQMPAKGGLASVFIDVIGMPLTPMSVAGADRRVWRRRAFYR
jgi:hypothetical protein